MEPIEELLRYPTRREDWTRTVLVGGALTLFGFLVVPAVLVTGYLLSVVRSRVEADDAPPAFRDWGELFVDGLRAWVVVFVYAVVPTVLGVGVLGGSIASMRTGSEVGVALGLLGMGVGGLVLLAVALVFYYLLPASLANLAVTGRLGDAFDVDVVRAVVTSRAYAVPWLWSVLVGVVAAPVAGALNVFPVVGWVASSLLVFYAEVVVAALWAAGYADALAPAGRGPGEAPDAAAT